MSLLAWLPLLAAALIATGVSYALSCVWFRPGAVPRLPEYAARLDRDLRFLRRREPAMLVAGAQITACALLGCTALLCASVGLLVLALVVAWMPGHWLERQRALRITRLEEQIDSWLLALANALRATPSLGDALASTVSLVPAPLCVELELALKEYQVGVALDEALLRIGTRVGSRTLSAALLTLRIARSAGGNLSACLERSAAALREMTRLEGVVRTKTAEGKAQAFVISVLPLPLFALLNWIDSAFLAPLPTCTTGQLILAIAATLWGAAVLLARRFAHVDI